MVCWKGDALAWYYYEESRQAFREWLEFKKSLLKGLHSSQIGNLMEKLLALRQTSSVGAYHRNFELLSALFLDLPEAMLENAFSSTCGKQKSEVRL